MEDKFNLYINKQKLYQEAKKQKQSKAINNNALLRSLVRFGFEFNDIPTFLGYSMSSPSFYKNTSDTKIKVVHP